MNVLVIGANGKVGKQLTALLAKGGHRVRAMIRKEGQAPDLQQLGAEPVVADLEGDFSHALRDCEAIVFCAGSGPHTGPDKTILVDLEGAIRSIEEAEKQGVRRYVMLSALRADEPRQGPENIRHYLVAKKRADDWLRRSSLDYTILRPGRLSNEPGAGTVSLAEHLAFRPDPISREDVARTLAATLEMKNTVRKTLDLLPGEVPIAEALKRI